jgi:hypothetical protein
MLARTDFSRWQSWVKNILAVFIPDSFLGWTSLIKAHVLIGIGGFYAYYSHDYSQGVIEKIGDILPVPIYASLFLVTGGMCLYMALFTQLPKAGHVALMSSPILLHVTMVFRDGLGGQRGGFLVAVYLLALYAETVLISLHEFRAHQPVRNPSEPIYDSEKSIPEIELERLLAVER